ncbi:MAG: hypothetical protein IH631_09965 [Candidatus Thorarchaeota archaeon]|nr:hypothetical protein [Candidatus Thorarchaeota archaeon]
MKISVDGHEYVMELDDRYGQNAVRVFQEPYGLIAEAEVDHNMEQICVDYSEYEGDSSDDVFHTTYSYWEYTTPEELAAWMVATHPEHQ